MTKFVMEIQTHQYTCVFELIVWIILITIVPLEPVLPSLGINPRYNWDKISNKAGDGTFQQSIIPDNDALRQYVALILLIGHWKQ